MILQTKLNIKPLEQTIRYGDGLLFLGSCFADEVGIICKDLGFNAMVNPFGVLYNPVSIAGAIQRLQSGKSFSHEDVIRTGDEFYCTFSHNTSFWRPTEAQLLEEANRSLAESHSHFANSKWVVVSFGTAWVYRYRETLEVVANCHKLPSRLFDRFRLSVPSMVSVLSDFVNACPDKQFIFTVSPLRHLKDGLHENQLSKATLLLAVDEVCKRHDNAHYFPAYEILLDELRDYRFYEEDMLHPSSQAVEFIWQRFRAAYFGRAAEQFLEDWRPIREAHGHKPFHPDSEAHLRFLAKTEEMERRFNEKYFNS